MDKPSSMEINPSRITIRPFKISDVDDFMLWAGDDQVTRYVKMKTFTSKEEALGVIKDVCKPHPRRKSICICIDDRSIGFVSVIRESGDNRCRAHLGYAVSKEYWSKGIATRAIKLVVNQVRKDWPDLVRLQALVDVDNKASQRVLEKCGFLQEGLLRKYEYFKGNIEDVLMYSMILSTDLLPTV